MSSYIETDSNGNLWLYDGEPGIGKLIASYGRDEHGGVDPYGNAYANGYTAYANTGGAGGATHTSVYDAWTPIIPEPVRICSYCRAEVKLDRSNCRNCGAPT